MRSLIAPLLLVVVVLLTCKESTRESAPAASASTQIPSAPFAPQEVKPLASSSVGPSKSQPASATAWYQGGTLHNKTALDWQKADDADKLATCADFLARLWMDKELKPEIMAQITTIDDLKPWAFLLAHGLDKACAKNPDPVLNKRMYTNQKVREMAALIILAAGWTRD